MSYSALYSWATGRRRPARQNVEKLARLAEVRAERLQELAATLRDRLDSDGQGDG